MHTVLVTTDSKFKSNVQHDNVCKFYKGSWKIPLIVSALLYRTSGTEYMQMVTKFKSFYNSQCVCYAAV